MRREEIRRRALGAAAAVSLTLGAIGCAGEVRVSSGSTAEGEGGAGGAGGAATLIATSTSTAVAAGGAGGEAPIVDAGVAVSDCSDASDYVACCQAAMWDFDAGCFAWGPPMPPAMPEVA